MRFSRNLTHGIWEKVNDCTVLYSTVQCSTVQVYLPALTLLRANASFIVMFMQNIIVMFKYFVIAMTGKMSILKPQPQPHAVYEGHMQ